MGVGEDCEGICGFICCRLHKATADDNSDLVRFCIEQLRIGVDAVDVFNQTALHWAASFHKGKPVLQYIYSLFFCSTLQPTSPSHHLPSLPAATGTLIATMLVENYGCDVNPVDLNGESKSLAALAEGVWVHGG